MSFHDDYSDPDIIVDSTECAHCHNDGAWMRKADPVRQALHEEKVMKRYHEDCYYDAAACI